MATRIIVDVSGNYRDAETTVRAAIALTKQGKRYAYINDRQIKAAAGRCCYAGTDYPVFSEIEGFSPWSPSGDGIVCYENLKK